MPTSPTVVGVGCRLYPRWYCIWSRSGRDCSSGLSDVGHVRCKKSSDRVILTRNTCVCIDTVAAEAAISDADIRQLLVPPTVVDEGILWNLGHETIVFLVGVVVCSFRLIAGLLIAWSITRSMLYLL